MEQRKLIQHGPSSLTIALPIKWLKERGIKKGDSMYIGAEGNKLVLSTEEAIKLEKISIDVTNLDRTSILLYIQSLYRFGYNEIEVKFEKLTTTHYRKDQQVTISSVIHEIANRLIGAEIIEESENRVLIKYITKEAEEDFKIVLRRAFLLLLSMGDEALMSLKLKALSHLSQTALLEEPNNRLTTVCRRSLNKWGSETFSKIGPIYYIIEEIENIADEYRYWHHYFLYSECSFD